MLNPTKERKKEAERWLVKAKFQIKCIKSFVKNTEKFINVNRAGIAIRYHKAKLLKAKDKIVLEDTRLREKLIKRDLLEIGRLNREIKSVTDVLDDIKRLEKKGGKEL